jgi:hypothetical protein
MFAIKSTADMSNWEFNSVNESPYLILEIQHVI